MLQIKFTPLAIVLFQCSLVLSAVLPSEYLYVRDASISNATIEKRALDLSEIAMLNNLQNAYKGVWWATAYPNAERPYGSKYDVSCDIENFNILVEATRNAVRLAEYAGSDTFLKDRSFNKFFVRNDIAPIGGRWTSSKDSQATEASIRHNMLLPSRFPLDGTKKSTRRSRVTYQCKDPETLPANAKGCSKSDVHAYAINPKWTPNVSENSLGALRYVSYEQVMLHEWLHCDIMGYSEHLTDLFDTIDDHLPKRKIYGMSSARDYAWKFMQGDKMNINQNIVANVENYVWYFVDKLYGKQWGWTGKGTAYPGRLPERGFNRMTRQTDIQATVENLDLGDESTDPATLPKPVWPANCHGEAVIDADDTSAIICDYIIPLGDESSSFSTPVASATSTSAPVITLPPDPKNCSCNEDGCTKESPACCDDGTR
ncbi:hypothetical protein BELL_0329g00110 [Botrytis elliptica]|uniref:Lysine-specific metallo-endopeptidase domain-containing protein n=1 Tax=Botrytis elliptica TaxID=278938 RepID=A0A4Z1JJC1_9HELO|nr:hypothetical protein BELL_0329g00110 [Botrytis elliptica]